MDAQKIIEGAKKLRRIPILIRFPIQLLSDIDSIASELGITRTKFIISALVEAVRSVRGGKK